MGYPESKTLLTLDSDFRFPKLCVRQKQYVHMDDTGEKMTNVLWKECLNNADAELVAFCMVKKCRDINKMFLTRILLTEFNSIIVGVVQIVETDRCKKNQCFKKRQIKERKKK